MRVRDYMTKNVITVPPDMLILDAQALMKQNNIHRLPVVEHGQLIGIVTQSRLREVAPSQATSLSIWEMNYILAKMKVSDAMARNVVTVTPDTVIEDAALLGHRKGVGSLPVVENGRLVGIISQTDTMRMMLEVLGSKETGVRLQIHDHEAARSHILADIAAVINKHGHTIHSIFKTHAPGRPHADVIVRLTSKQADDAIEELVSLGFKVEVV